MKIRDISDRIYQGQVYALLDRARSSIVISMYLIRPGEDPKHPVNRLLEDLLGARRRGVEVAIYLNTKFQGEKDLNKVADGPWFLKLQKAGVQIRRVSPVKRLHDKLIVVDRRFVVEGSTNWSVSAIADNFESATLIDSPELAESKLRRIGFLPIWGEEEKKLPKGREALFPAGPPSSLEVPIALLEERRYFPKMIHYQRTRALKMYLLFLYLAAARGGLKFTFPPEEVGEYLGILRGKDRSAVRRQVIRVLRDLQDLDKLLKVEFRHGKDAYVELFPPPGPTFTVGSDELEAGEMAELDDNRVFFQLVRSRLSREDKRLEELSQAEITRRFFIDDKTLRRTLGPALRRGRPPVKSKTETPVSTR